MTLRDWLLAWQATLREDVRQANLDAEATDATADALAREKADGLD